MPQNIHCSFNAASRIHLALTVVAALAFLTWVPSRVRAQDASPTQTTADTETVGERLRRATDPQRKIADFADNTGAIGLAKILVGDWIFLFEDEEQTAKEINLRCKFNHMVLRQPDPKLPILEGLDGAEGDATRVELRISKGTSVSLISNIRDEMRMLGFQEGAVKNSNALDTMMRFALMQRNFVPENNNVVVSFNSAKSGISEFLIRCPNVSGETASMDQNIQTVNRIKKRIAQQLALSSYGPDGIPDFVSELQGKWTLVDQNVQSEIEHMTISELCRIRQIEMRWDQKPFPILTSHVIDVSSDRERPVPASQDEFELRLAGDGELLRVSQHDPMVEVRRHPENYIVPPAEEEDFSAMFSQRKFIGRYRDEILSYVLPVTLLPDVKDSFVETVISWNYPFNDIAGPGGTKRYWFKCPEERRKN